MRIKVISSKSEIDTQGSDEEIVHLAFRPSNKDILILIQKYPHLKAIHLPNSYEKTISSSTQMLLDMQNIKLLVGDVWGHRKDINEYYEIKPEIFDRINALRNEGKSKEEMIKKLEYETRLSKDLVNFLI